MFVYFALKTSTLMLHSHKLSFFFASLAYFAVKTAKGQGFEGIFWLPKSPKLTCQFAYTTNFYIDTCETPILTASN